MDTSLQQMRENIKDQREYVIKFYLNPFFYIVAVGNSKGINPRTKIGK